MTKRSKTSKTHVQRVAVVLTLAVRQKEVAVVLASRVKMRGVTVVLAPRKRKQSKGTSSATQMGRAQKIGEQRTDKAKQDGV